jgi:hypothetical protein
MDIKPEHITRKEVIGEIKGQSVIHIRTMGGLEVLIKKNGTEVETLAVAPHIGIAKYIVQKKHPKVVFTQLHKSDPYPAWCLEQDSAVWVKVTEQVDAKVRGK